MKKVGILTFHRALNYGATLQAYALQQFLIDNGINNEIVDYVSPKIEESYKPFHVNKHNYLRAVARGMLCSNTIKRKKKVFDMFRNNYLILSDTYYSKESLERINSEYEYFICGSDQVWSPGCVGFDENYFLTFAQDDKKYSYAASLGVKKIPPNLETEYYRRLHGFQGVSVREKDAKEVIAKYVTSSPLIHIDPTLLLRQEDWFKIANKRLFNRPYILVFNVEKEIEDIDFAKKLGINENMDIVYINDRTVMKDKKIKYVIAPSPIDFICYFRYASYVVTNSFHGTAFSVMFHNEFFVELNNRNKRNVRAEALLSMLDIKGRDISDKETLDIYSTIQWDKVDSIIEEKRNESIKYFMDIGRREVDK